MNQPQIFVNKRIGLSICSLAVAIYIFITMLSSTDAALQFMFIILLFGTIGYFHIYKLIIDNDKVIEKTLVCLDQNVFLICKI